MIGMIRFQTLAGLTLIGTAALASPALAQTGGDSLTVAQEDLEARLDAPQMSSSGGRLRPAIRLLGSTTDSAAQITFSTHDEAPGSLSNTDFAITITAPLSKDTKRASFVTVDGLPNQLSVGFSLTTSLVDIDGAFRSPASDMKFLRKATDSCLTASANQSLSASARQDKCEGLDAASAFQYLSAEDQQEWSALRQRTYDAVMARPFSIVSLSAEVGTRKFAYFDTGTLGELSDRKVSYSAGVWFGYLPNLKSKVFLVAGFEAKRDYEAADEATYCPVGTPGPTVKCTTGPFGPPTAETDYKLAGKLRFKLGDALPVGLEISAAYDLEDDKWGVEVPIYLLPNKDGGLVGGLRGAYDSKKDDFQFGIFIGKTFDFLKL